MSVLKVLTAAFGCLAVAHQADASGVVVLGGDPHGSLVSISISDVGNLTVHSEWLRERCVSPLSVDQVSSSPPVHNCRTPITNYISRYA